MHLLVVDDDVRITKSVCRACPRQHSISSADSGARAFEVLAQDRMSIDAVVADYRMPGMDGIELLQELAVDHPRVGRVLMSGEADFLTASHAIFREAASHLLAKPFSMGRLFATSHAAVRAVRDGGSGSGGSRPVTSNDGLPPIPEIRSLTPRQRMVLERFYRRRRVVFVAEDLYVTEKTIRNHLSAVAAKLGVRDQIEVLRRLDEFDGDT